MSASIRKLRSLSLKAFSGLYTIADVDKPTDDSSTPSVLVAENIFIIDDRPNIPLFVFDFIFVNLLLLIFQKIKIILMVYTGMIAGPQIDDCFPPDIFVGDPHDVRKRLIAAQVSACVYP